MEKELGQGEPSQMSGVVKPKERLTPESWILGAVEALLEEGHEGVRVTRLARRLGVTPGSFYWHFRDRDHFRGQFLQYWRSELLRGAGAAAKLAGTGAERIRALPDILFGRNLPDLDAALRIWARAEPEVAEALAKADELRTRMLIGLIEDAGVRPEHAALRARIFFWAVRGSTGVDQELRIEAAKEMIEAFMVPR